MTNNNTDIGYFCLDFGEVSSAAAVRLSYIHSEVAHATEWRVHSIVDMLRSGPSSRVWHRRKHVRFYSLHRTATFGPTLGLFSPGAQVAGSIEPIELRIPQSF